MSASDAATAEPAAATAANADPAPPHPERLRVVHVLADLGADDLAWIAERGEWLAFEPGGVVTEAGAPADAMTLVLEGELQARAPGTGGEVLFRARAGEVAGKLPFSRMERYALSVRAAGPTRLVRLGDTHFSEMLRRVPVLEARLVALMTDRVRESARSDQQREKLVSLGKLAAGLAHELNNPASAAVRAVSHLRRAEAELQRRSADLYRHRLDAEEMEAVDAMRRDAEALRRAAPPLAPLARSDAEEALAAWLEALGLAEGWEVAPVLVAAGVDAAWLEGALERVCGEASPALAAWLAAALEVDALMREVEESASRVSAIVGAVKGYTYLDQAPTQEVDVHDGLEATLRMLAHRVDGRVAVERDYDRALPRLEARGSELNDVWTKLIENALDALEAAHGSGGGGRVRLRTGRDGDWLRVEVGDSGPGIPAEILDRIWDPFFTTREVGQGTGLGLYVARRVVGGHGGELRVVSSAPGDTRFQVRLPLNGRGEGGHAA